MHSVISIFTMVTRIYLEYTKNVSDNMELHISPNLDIICIKLSSLKKLCLDLFSEGTPLEVKQTSRVGPWRSKIADCWWRWSFFFQIRFVQQMCQDFNSQDFVVIIFGIVSASYIAMYSSFWVNQIIQT